MDENEVEAMEAFDVINKSDASLDLIWNYYYKIQRVGKALGLEKAEIENSSDDALQLRAKQNQKELLTINSYLSRLAEIIKEYECSISVEEKDEVCQRASDIYEEFKEKWKEFLDPELAGSVTTTYATESATENAAMLAVNFAAGAAISLAVNFAVSAVSNFLLDKYGKKVDPTSLSPRTIAKMPAADKIPAMFMSIHFGTMNTKLIKIIKKNKTFTVMKEIYDILVNFKHQYHDLIFSGYLESIFKMVNDDQILKNKKKFIFKDQNPTRDEAMLATLTAGVKGLNAKKAEVDSLAGFDAKAMSALDSTSSPEEVTITSDQVMQFMFGTPEMTISQTLGQTLAVLTTPKTAKDVFAKNKKAIEVYQPVSSVRPDNVKAPIVAYFYYEIKLFELLMAANMTSLQYGMVTYQILRYIRPTGNDDNTVLDMMK